MESKDTTEFLIFFFCYMIGTSPLQFINNVHIKPLIYVNIFSLINEFHSKYMYIYMYTAKAYQEANNTASRSVSKCYVTVKRP